MRTLALSASAMALLSVFAGASTLEIPLGVTPEIDGAFDASEWAGATTVEFAANERAVQVRAHLVHDGEYLFVAFEYIKNLDAELVLPEVLIDAGNEKTEDWADGDWWFHVSAQNCEAQGEFDNYGRCGLTRPHWLGRPNFAPGAASEALPAVEIRIPLDLVGIAVEVPFGLSLTVNAWPSDTRGYWPEEADITMPASWGVAVLVEPVSDPFSRPPSTPEAEDMDPAPLETMMDAICAQNARKDSGDTIDSVIVIRHGNVVLEAYPNPLYSAESRHHLFSVTKTITSLLIGIAIDRGLIESAVVPILGLFAGLLPRDEVQSKSVITVEHLLTMSAGLEWDEDTWPSNDPRNDFFRLEFSREPIAYVLGKPQVAPPGELFWYNSGLSHVLSAVIAEAAGMSTLQFARQALFSPLGIEDLYWRQDMTGLHKGGTQLYMRPRDLARIGALCLNGGRWDGAQIVSEVWLEQSTRTRIHGRQDYFAGRSYAYHWWTLDDYDVFYAAGSQGQFLYVFPEMETIVVFTATILEGALSPEVLARDYLVPAMLSAP